MTQAQPAPQLTRGFAAFIAAMLLPGIIALVVFFGAWAVSDEVYAAELRAEQGSAVTADGDPAGEVAGWKRTLVGVCPIH
ncbi:MAG: hypothetical protein AB7F65_08635 [Dehalococcoidia bacterium]